MGFFVPAGMAAAKLGTAKLGAAALSAGLSAGTTIWQNIANRRAQERAFQQNKQFWYERFDKEAQYNHPLEQMARLKEAGLNPALMYKSGAGGAGSVAGPSAQGKVAEKYDLANLAMVSAQTAKIVNDAKKSKAEADLIRENTILSQLKGKGQITLNEQALVDLALKQVELQYKDDEKKQQLEKLIQEALKMKADAEKAGTQAEMAKSEQYILDHVHKRAAEYGIDLKTSELGMIMGAILKGGDVAFDIVMKILKMDGADPQGPEVFERAMEYYKNR